jgi:hypothetical protein
MLVGALLGWFVAIYGGYLIPGVLPMRFLVVAAWSPLIRDRCGLPTHLEEIV